MTIRDTLHQIKCDGSTNLALWLDRFVGSRKMEDVGKFHNSLHEQGAPAVPDGYKKALSRRKADLETLELGWADGEAITHIVELKSQGRLVVGIGSASVRETGISLLRPWGMPYIPGSALKGLVSHMAHELGAAEPRWCAPETSGGKAGEFHRAIFGDVTEGGSVIFHDAWWMKGSSTHPVWPDVMTVHHQAYYQGTASACDWDDPIPVSFLTAEGTFQGALSGPKEAVHLCLGLLDRGLADQGIGAKTAAGYGRMSRVLTAEEATAQAERSERGAEVNKAQEAAARARENLQPRISIAVKNWKGAGENSAIDKIMNDALASGVDANTAFACWTAALDACPANKKQLIAKLPSCFKKDPYLTLAVGAGLRVV